jgi:hypothetical protein
MVRRGRRRPRPGGSGGRRGGKAGRPGPPLGRDVPRGTGGDVCPGSCSRAGRTTRGGGRRPRRRVSGHRHADGAQGGPTAASSPHPPAAPSALRSGPCARRGEPEGWRRQDDHGREPRRRHRRDRRPGAAGRPGPAGQRELRHRHAPQGGAADDLPRPHRGPRSARCGAAHQRPQPVPSPHDIDLAGAEIELVSVFSREQRLRRALDTVRTSTTSSSSTAHRASGC